MTPTVLGSEPACPGTVEQPGPTPRGGPGPALRVEPRSIDRIPAATWDELAARTSAATPFSSWAFHRAWWDAYAENAREETLVAVPADGKPGDPSAVIVGIIPLMRRHEVEPTDALTHTVMRHAADAPLTPVAPTAEALFFGASYHADYATILCALPDLDAVCSALAAHLASAASGSWEVVDLRRLRCDDPAGDALAAALGAVEMTHGWTLNVEREDVCPVVTLPKGADIDGYLATLDKKERHEIRRKVRRAEAAGAVELVDSADPVADLDAFIDLHQRRWGDDGLFPQTPGGDQSRVLFRRLFELFGSDGPLRLSFLTVGGRQIAAGVHFETTDGILYYNAGVDPDARDLSPGIVMVYAYMVRALAAGRRRVDFLRGDEPYKYTWGAIDEPIRRLLVRRGVQP